MEFGINNIKDLLESASYVITSFSLLAIITTYFYSKKQIHFSTIEKCINDFRNLEIRQRNVDENQKIAQYFDLVNEELFYIENNYLPKEVSIEWIDGMIDYLPFINFNDEFIKSFKYDSLNSLDITKTYLQDFPRIKKFIKITNSTIDFEKIWLPSNNDINEDIRHTERDKLILNLISNLKINKFKIIFYKMKIKHR